MIVYLADKKQFLSDSTDRPMEDVIHRQFRKMTGRSVGPSELRSWKESLLQVANVLRDPGIPDTIGVAVEYHIPQSSKRLDVTLTGFGTKGAKKAIILELKQWDRALATALDGVVRTRIGRGMREVVHPSYQAWSYAQLLEGFNTAVYEGAIALHPCAYLHNYERDGQIDHAAYGEYITKAPIFLRGEQEREKLRAFIKRFIRKGDKTTVLHELEEGKIRPSKALADSLGGLLNGNPEFVLIDEQKTVYEAALAAGVSASAQKQRVVLIEGGPGTGKTVVAMNLLVALTQHRLHCQYVSRNGAPRAVYQAKLTGSKKANRFNSLFTGSGSFYSCPPFAYDVLIVDEAHRLNELSGFYGNKGENQIKELIAAAKCAVFFLDEDQRVTLKDIGTRQQIEAFAAERGAKLERYTLASQFRCNGSDEYLAWLDNTLQKRPTANTIFERGSFDVRVYDSPEELHEAIECRNGGDGARVVAGYCWPWRSKKDPRSFDIEIGTYRRRWNMAAQGGLWMITPGSIEEVGCIHTCQGLELDYIGVIIGPDLVVRNGRVMTLPEKRDRRDQTIKGYVKLLRRDPSAAELIDSIIKNTYKTLLTRGMKGCYIYAVDEETREHFRKVLA